MQYVPYDIVPSATFLPFHYVLNCACTALRSWREPAERNYETEQRGGRDEPLFGRMDQESSYRRSGPAYMRSSSTGPSSWTEDSGTFLLFVNDHRSFNSW